MATVGELRQTYGHHTMESLQETYNGAVESGDTSLVEELEQVMTDGHFMASREGAEEFAMSAVHEMYRSQYPTRQAFSESHRQLRETEHKAFMENLDDGSDDVEDSQELQRMDLLSRDDKFIGSYIKAEIAERETSYEPVETSEFYRIMREAMENGDNDRVYAIDDDDEVNLSKLHKENSIVGRADEFPNALLGYMKEKEEREYADMSDRDIRLLELLHTTTTHDVDLEPSPNEGDYDGYPDLAGKTAKESMREHEG